MPGYTPIRRADLIRTVEASIAHAPTLNDTEKALLRHVAQTETFVVRGDYYKVASSMYGTPYCGCPMTSAGLWSVTDGFGEDFAHRDPYAFVSAFDDLSKPLVVATARGDRARLVLKVVD